MRTVMVVEDSITDMELLTLYLQKEGLTVVPATNGEEAQTKLQQFKKPDLIVLDVILPGQSGFELCRKLKANPETKSIPVVLCSTKNTDLDQKWGMMGGADAYVTKPINPMTLLETVYSLMYRAGGAN
jgi:two-component system, chemotaxis family, response regulator PixH